MKNEIITSEQQEEILSIIERKFSFRLKAKHSSAGEWGGGGRHWEASFKPEFTREKNIFIGIKDTGIAAVQQAIDDLNKWEGKPKCPHCLRYIDRK